MCLPPTPVLPGSPTRAGVRSAGLPTFPTQCGRSVHFLQSLNILKAPTGGVYHEFQLQRLLVQQIIYVLKWAMSTGFILWYVLASPDALVCLLLHAVRKLLTTLLLLLLCTLICTVLWLALILVVASAKRRDSCYSSASLPILCLSASAGLA